MRGGFLAFEYKKAFRICTALGNLILDKSSSGKADFGLPSCLTVRLAELSHAGDVIGHALPTNLLVMDGIKLGGEEIVFLFSSSLALWKTVFLD